MNDMVRALLSALPVGLSHEALGGPSEIATFQAEHLAESGYMLVHPDYPMTYSVGGDEA